MKKKKRIILISIILLISVITYVKWDTIQYIYCYLLDNYLWSQVDEIYFIIIDNMSDDVIFSNGEKSFRLQTPWVDGGICDGSDEEVFAWEKKREKRMKELFIGYTTDYPYYGIFSNCVVRPDDRFRGYEIEILGGSDEFSAVSDKSFHIDFDIDFDENAWGEDLHLYVDKYCKSFKVEIQEGYIRCYVNNGFGMATKIVTDYSYFTFPNLDVEVKSFEIRKGEEGKIKVYLDMDGDGVYENNDSEYLSEIPVGFREVSQFPMKLTHLLPGGFENMEFNINLGRGGGYLFREIDGVQTQYYTVGDGRTVSELSAYGGVVMYLGLQKEFKEGKLTLLSEPYEHFHVEEEEYLEQLETPALLWKVGADLNVGEEGIPAEAHLWCVMFSTEESDATYALLLNAEYFSKQHILTIAESVEFSEDAFEDPWYYCSQPSVTEKNKVTVYEDEVYLIGDSDIWVYDLEENLRSERNLLQYGFYREYIMPNKIFTSRENELCILDKEGKLYKVLDNLLEYVERQIKQINVEVLLESFYPGNQQIIVNGYVNDKSRKVLLEDGRIIGILDESVVVCNMELPDEKIVYLSGDFALSDKGNIFQIELFEENGIQKNYTECIYSGGDIVDIDAYYGCVAVKSDGSALYFPQNSEPDNRFGEEEISKWKDVVTVSSDRLYSVGLTSDGRVLFAGSEVAKQCSEEVEELSQWRDIVKICAVSGTVAGIDKWGKVHIMKLEP